MGTHINTCPLCGIQAGNLTTTEIYKETNEACTDPYACKYRARMLEKLRTLTVDFSNQDKQIYSLSLAINKLTGLVGSLARMIKG